MLAQMRTNLCRLQYSQDFAHDKLSKEASLMQINVGLKEWLGYKGKGVPFGLTKDNEWNKITQMCMKSMIKYASAHMQEILSSFKPRFSFGAGFKNNVNFKQANKFQEEFSRLKAYKIFQEMLKLIDMFS